MAEFDRYTATADAPGYDGSDEVLRHRQLLLHAYISGVMAPGSGIHEDIEESYYGGGTLSRANAPANTIIDPVQQ